MFKYVNEILEEIEKAKGKKKIDLLKEHGAVAPLSLLLSLNFDETIKRLAEEMLA